MIPTRDRRDFVRQSLSFLNESTFADFEVVIADNPSEDAKSCETVVNDFNSYPIRYVRASADLSMLDNWNAALEAASGEYVAFFTDKMMLLPETLAQADAALAMTGAEVVSWSANTWTPEHPPDFFGRGVYRTVSVHQEGYQSYFGFDPREAFRKRLAPSRSRSEMSPVEYAIGKICFGAFGRDLIQRIVARCGTLFHPFSPDYTSMALGLMFARSGVFMGRPGIVHLNTDISNGHLCDTNDQHALRFYSSVDGITPSDLYVPGLYTSTHNSVVTDYRRMMSIAGDPEEIDPVPWVCLMVEDLARREGSWSSSAVRTQQEDLLAAWIEFSLSPHQRRLLEAMVNGRAAEADRSRRAPGALLRHAIHGLPPDGQRFLFGTRRKVMAMLRRGKVAPSVALQRLTDVIELER